MAMTGEDSRGRQRNTWWKTLKCVFGVTYVCLQYDAMIVMTDQFHFVTVAPVDVVRFQSAEDLLCSRQILQRMRNSFNYQSLHLLKAHAPFPCPPVSVVMTGSYNNFFRMFDRGHRRDVTLEASRENSKPMQVLKPRKVCAGGKRKKDEISVDSLDFNKKILHTAWHPQDNIIAVATTNNLYIFQDKVN